jgi:hypothetical protein
VFTQQFWQIAKSRLNDGGVFGQWVNLFNMDVTTLRSIFRAFYDVFPYGITFFNLDNGDLLLFGSNKPIKFDYERVQNVLNQPKIAATLRNHDINTPEDLLWYFALSRGEVMAVTGNMTPNTDTNILSEVRLSAITQNPVGKEDPYAFLRENSLFDLAPYVDNPAQRLYAQADFFFSKYDMIMAKKAGKSLAKLNPLLSRGVEYEYFWRTYDFDAAFSLYDKHQDWPDRTHAQQALALLELGRQHEAQLAIARIKDVKVKRTTEARILFELGDWVQLTALQTQSDEERKWQLLGLSKQNAVLAGRDLSRLVAANSEEIPQLRALVQYAAALDDRKTMDEYARRLIKATDNYTWQLGEFAKQALEKKQMPRARLLMSKIESLNPAAKELSDLRQRISEAGTTEKISTGKTAKTMPDKGA